jgi:hypothetical protein
MPSEWSTPPIEFDLTPEEMSKLGELFLVWSHTEHIIAKSLKEILKYNDEDAINIIYPMMLQRKLSNITKHSSQLSDGSRAYFEELKSVVEAVTKLIRNTVAHGVLVNDTKEGILFRSPSKDWILSKDDVLASQEISNYALRIAIDFYHSLNPDEHLAALPERPKIPEALRERLPDRKND